MYYKEKYFNTPFHNRDFNNHETTTIISGHSRSFIAYFKAFVTDWHLKCNIYTDFNFITAYIKNSYKI
jgi:hypothetical protein